MRKENETRREILEKDVQCSYNIEVMLTILWDILDIMRSFLYNIKVVTFWTYKTIFIKIKY